MSKYKPSILRLLVIFIVAFLSMLVITPILVNAIITSPALFGMNIAKDNDWIGFYGNFLGSMFGVLASFAIAIMVVFIERRDRLFEAKRREQLDLLFKFNESQRKIYGKLMDYHEKYYKYAKDLSENISSRVSYIQKITSYKKFNKRIGYQLKKVRNSEDIKYLEEQRNILEKKYGELGGPPQDSPTCIEELNKASRILNEEAAEYLSILLLIRSLFNSDEEYQEYCNQYNRIMHYFEKILGYMLQQLRNHDPVIRDIFSMKTSTSLKIIRLNIERFKYASVVLVNNLNTKLNRIDR